MSNDSPIVVLDDDLDTVTFLCDFLEMLGFDVLTCPLSSHAADWIAQHHPALVVLDIDLGAMSGIDVFQALRADSATHGVPVIFFTGSEDRLRNAVPDYAARNAALVVKPLVEHLGTLVQDQLKRAA